MGSLKNKNQMLNLTMAILKSLGFTANNRLSVNLDF